MVVAVEATTTAEQGGPAGAVMVALQVTPGQGRTELMGLVVAVVALRVTAPEELAVPVLLS